MSIFILRYKEKKLKGKMDPIFEHPAFDSAREKMKRFIRRIEKSQEDFENSLCTCFKCGSTIYFLLQNKLGQLMREHLYLMNVTNVTVNGGMDDAHYATNIQPKNRQWVYQPSQSHQTF